MPPRVYPRPDTRIDFRQVFANLGGPHGFVDLVKTYRLPPVNATAVSTWISRGKVPMEWLAAVAELYRVHLQRPLVLADHIASGHLKPLKKPAAPPPANSAREFAEIFGTSQPDEKEEEYVPRVIDY